MIEPSVTDHYARPDLLAAIETGLQAAGVDPATPTVDDLGPVDEFHLGGRHATMAVLDQLALGPGSRVLDIGCGLGGAARLCADRSGAHVTGIDLTVDYLAVGRELTNRVGLADKVDLREASALDLPVDDASFDAAYQLHVGMNIADKVTMAAEVARAVRPGGRYAVYDIMRVGSGEVTYPVPWAATEATSFLASPDDYSGVLADAGFDVVAQRNRAQFALDALARVRQAAAEPSGPPPLGLHLLMGAEAPVRFANMTAAVASGTLAPVEIIAVRS